jgi:hypothetical protein
MKSLCCLRMFLSSLALACLFMASPAKADLVLTVDLGAEELFLSGSDSGTPDSAVLAFSDGGPVLQNTSLVVFLSDPQVLDGSTQLFNTDSLPNSAVVTGNLFGPDPILGISESASGVEEIFLDFEFFNNAQTTISGTSTRFSFASLALSPTDITTLISFDGQTIPRYNDPSEFGLGEGVFDFIVQPGTGFEGLTVNVVAVPEPNGLIVLCLAGLGFAVTRRKVSKPEKTHVD